MIVIDIPHKAEDPPVIESDRIPQALRHAIAKTYELYPKVVNDDKNKDMRFDRLFETLYNCKIEYNEHLVVSRVVWADDRDYTVFLLKWS